MPPSIAADRRHDLPLLPIRNVYLVTGFFHSVDHMLQFSVRCAFFHIDDHFLLLPLLDRSLFPPALVPETVCTLRDSRTICRKIALTASFSSGPSFNLCRRTITEDSRPLSLNGNPIACFNTPIRLQISIRRFSNRNSLMSRSSIVDLYFLIFSSLFICVFSHKNKNRNS